MYPRQRRYTLGPISTIRRNNYYHDKKMEKKLITPVKFGNRYTIGLSTCNPRLFSRLLAPSNPKRSWSDHFFHTEQEMNEPQGEKYVMFSKFLTTNLLPMHTHPFRNSHTDQIYVCSCSYNIWSSPKVPHHRTQNILRLDKNKKDVRGLTSTMSSCSRKPYVSLASDTPPTNALV